MKQIKSRNQPSPLQPLQTHVINKLQASYAADASIKLALSGGLDSVVLLHLLVTCTHSFQLSAVHVHHGLSAFADSWADFCCTLCHKHNIPVDVIKVKVAPDSGLGVEAAARVLRYEALLRGDFDVLVTAHHQDDQAETLLLQLFRGAGVKGLSAMPVIDNHRKIIRPLLDISRAELLLYAEKNKLNWIEDDSNQNKHYERNFLRLDIMPQLQVRYSGLTNNLARSASHFAEAAHMLDELAELDAGACTSTGTSLTQISVKLLAALSTSRAKNLLRWWLNKQSFAMPSAAKLDEILAQLIFAKTDAQVKLVLDSKTNSVIRRYQSMAYVIRDTGAQPYAIAWQGEEILQLPDNTQLQFVQKMGVGLAINRLQINKLRISNRQGSEEFKPDLNRPTRTLKHCLQAAHMPPWLRVRLPLIYLQDDLAIVPNIGIASHLQARPDEMGLNVLWSALA